MDKIPIEIVKYILSDSDICLLHTNKNYYNKLKEYFPKNWQKTICNYAARNGHLGVLK